MLGSEIVLLDQCGHKRRHTYVACDTCAAVFPKAKRFVCRDKHHYCSHDCAQLGRRQRIDRVCPVCGQKFVVRPHRIKSKTGVVCCSVQCKNIASTLEMGIIKCDHYSDGSYTYRDIALRNYPHECELCGDKIVELLDAHHIDHNRKNNAVENLMLVCPYCHALETRRLIAIRSDRMPIVLAEQHRNAIMTKLRQLCGTN